MKLRQTILFAALSMPVLLLAQASAQTVKPLTRLVTTQGCVFYTTEFFSAQFTNPAGPAATWSGSCTPGQPISGKGSLIKNVSGDGYTQRQTWTGTLVGGYLNGPVTWLNESVYFGKAQPTERGTSLYKMGCRVDVKGVIREMDPCVPAHP